MSATVTAAQVKELRDRTNVGMMECKKALTEANGNVDEAVQILRKRGIMKNEGRSGRTAAEGAALAAISPDQTHGVVVEVNCETDFSARSEAFQAAAKEIVEAALAKRPADLASLLTTQTAKGRTAEDALIEIRTTIGEKIELTTYEQLSGDVVAAYAHFDGKSAALVAAKAEGLAGDKKAAVAKELRGVAMHVTANNPLCLDSGEVPESVLAAERDVAATLARNEGKPEQIIPKIVEGRIKSFFKDNCLVEQPFAMEQKLTVREFVEQVGKTSGAKLTLTGFKGVKVGAKAAKAAKAEGGEA